MYEEEVGRQVGSERSTALLLPPFAAGSCLMAWLTEDGNKTISLFF